MGYRCGARTERNTQGITHIEKTYMGSFPFENSYQNYNPYLKYVLLLLIIHLRNAYYIILISGIRIMLVYMTKYLKVDILIGL